MPRRCELHRLGQTPVVPLPVVVVVAVVAVESKENIYEINK